MSNDDSRHFNRDWMRNLTVGLVLAAVGAGVTYANGWLSRDGSDTASANPAPSTSSAAEADITAEVTVDAACHTYAIDKPPGDVPIVAGNPSQWAEQQDGGAVGESEFHVVLQSEARSPLVLTDARVVPDGAISAKEHRGYVAGDGCGGNLPERAFGINLDWASPVVTPIGEPGPSADAPASFPFTVSATDPEDFFFVVASLHTSMKYHLELDYVEAGKRRTLRVDDNGTPFSMYAEGSVSPVYGLADGQWVSQEVPPVVTDTSVGPNQTYCGPILTADASYLSIGADQNVDCAEALKVASSYFNDTNLTPEGSGGFVTIGAWTCGSESAAGAQVDRHVGSCESDSGDVDFYPPY